MTTNHSQGALSLCRVESLIPASHPLCSFLPLPPHTDRGTGMACPSTSRPCPSAHQWCSYSCSLPIQPPPPLSGSSCPLRSLPTRSPFAVCPLAPDLMRASVSPCCPWFPVGPHPCAWADLSWRSWHVVLRMSTTPSCLSCWQQMLVAMKQPVLPIPALGAEGCRVRDRASSVVGRPPCPGGQPQKPTCSGR